MHCTIFLNNTLMKLAIWTKSPPKIQAIKKACKKYPHLAWKDITFISEAISSWVWDMPLSLEENMKWAKNRAQWMKDLLESSWNTADYYIWMEGWWMLVWDQGFLLWVVCVIDNNCKHHYGFSNTIELPEEIQKRLYINKEELWPIMDELTGKHRTKDWEGCIWTWTENIYTRETEFMWAFICAISPFFNIFYK